MVALFKTATWAYNVSLLTSREFYGLARFDHPSPASLEVLHTHFPDLHQSYRAHLVPSINGESISTLHDRIAYTLHRIIASLDSDPSNPKALLICTHAAAMIAIGRALTGQMPEDVNTEDFKCYTCSLSKFVRREVSTSRFVTPSEEQKARQEEEEVWDPSSPEVIPKIQWRGGRGVQRGWNCTVNGDCSFLRGGEERGW